MEISNYIKRLNELQDKITYLEDTILNIQTDYPFISACQKRYLKKKDKDSMSKDGKFVNEFTENGITKVTADNGIMSKRINIDYIDARGLILDGLKIELCKTKQELNDYVKNSK